MSSVVSRWAVFGLVALLLFFGCASPPQTPTAPDQPAKPVKIENLALPDSTPPKPAPQPALPPDELRGLLMVDYPNGGRDFEILLPGQQATLRNGAKVVLNYITPGTPDSAKLVINDQVYTIFAGQKQFAGLSGAFDTLEKPSKVSARIQMLDAQGRVVQEYKDLKVGSTVWIADSPYVIEDIIYGKSTKQKFVTFYKDGNSYRFVAGRALFNDAHIIIDVVPIEDKPEVAFQQNLILPTPPSTVKNERAYVLVSYPDGVSQLVVLPQGEAARLKDGKVFRVERLDVDYTFAANRLTASVQGETSTFRIGEIKEIGGVSVQLRDILSSANLKADFELKDKSGKTHKISVKRGGKFSFDGTECSVDDIYGGITLSVSSVQFSCQTTTRLIHVGESIGGKTESLRLLSVVMDV